MCECKQSSRRPAENLSVAFDAAVYLRSALPALIASREAPGPLPRATVQLVVRGGVKVHYRLDPEAGLTVHDGVSDTQDLTLVFIDEDLEAFSEGRLDLDAALRSQRLKVHGDTNLLAWLAEHLTH